MTGIKICGIKSIADGLAACYAGADAVGFIAVGASKRYVTPDEYHNIVAFLPPFVVPVVVAETIADALAYNPVCIQYYGGSDGAQAPIRTVRAIRPQNASDLRDVVEHAPHADAVLLDAYHPDMLGGAGVSFDWRLFVEASRLTDKPLILSGGLTPDNVSAAIQVAKPYAVDVSSGVESAPGVKDHAMIAAFIAAVRATDCQP